MKVKEKAKRVSWASGANLCQVKHIEKAKYPSKVGPRGQNIPPRKALCFRNRCTATYAPKKGESSSKKYKEKLSRIPQIQWRVPPVFVLKSNWRVASGEESEETAVQKLREGSVLEAVYPHFSAIPSSPFTASDVEDQCYDDSQTPDIPIYPIEEAESAATPESVLQLPDHSKSMAPAEALNLLKKTNDLPPDPSRASKPAPMASNAAESDRLLAAVDAVIAIMKTIDPGSSVDTELLIKLVRDPKMTMELINEHRLGADNVNRPSDSKITEPFIPLVTSKANLEIKNSNNEESNSFISINATIEIVARSGSDLLSGKPTEKQGYPTNSESQVSSPSLTSDQPQFLVTKADSVSTPMPGKLAVSLPSSVVDLPRKKFIPARQLVNAEIKKVPNPIISPSIAAETGTKSCFRLKPGQKPETSEVTQTDKAATEQLNSTNVQNDAPAIPRPRINSLGEKIHGTGFTPKPLLNQEQSKCQAVKDVHEVHDHAGQAHFPQTKPPTANPSQPDLEVLKKVIKDYGLPDLQNILLELAPAVTPIHTQESAPLEDGSQFTHQPAAFGPSSFSVRTTTTSLQGDNSLAPAGDNLHTIQHPAAFGPSPFSARNSAPPLKSNNSLIATGENPRSTQNPGAFGSSHFSSETGAPPLKGNNSLGSIGDKPQSTEHPGAFGSSHFSARTVAPPLKGNNSLEPIGDNLQSTEQPGAFGPSPFSRTAESPLKGDNSLGPADDNPQSTQHPAAFVPLTSSDRTAAPLPIGDESLEPEGGNPQSPLHPVTFGPSTFSGKTTASALKNSDYQPLINQHKEGQDNQDHEQSPRGDTQSYLRRPEFIRNRRTKESDPKHPKVCMYFNTRRGCLKGPQCDFRHEVVNQWRYGTMSEPPGSKRMKLGRELVGKNINTRLNIL